MGRRWKEIAVELFDRYIAVVDCFILVILAAFLAAAIDSLIAGRMEVFVASQKEMILGGSSKPVVKRKSTISKISSFKSVDGKAILSRNFFDSVTGPLDMEGSDLADLLAAQPEASADAADPDQPPPRCEDPVFVVGLFASKDPEWSFAAVRDGAEIEILGIGDTIRQYRIEDITWRYLFLARDNGARHCHLDIWEQETTPLPGKQPIQPGAKIAAKGKKPQPQKNANLARMMNEHIESVSATEKNVDRQLVDYLMNNKQELMKSGGKVIPNMQDGKIDGFKIFGIRKKSLWAELGFNNGDVINSINGKPLSGPSAALGMFSEFKGADSISVNLSRSGKSMNIDLNIR
jgi:general secretion pathway protein C